MEGCIEGKGEGSMDRFHEGAEVGLDVVVELGERVGLLDGSNIDWVDGLQLRVVDDTLCGAEVGETDDIVLGEVERVILG